ncbi:MAG: hypothetical protein ACLSIL_08285 [Enterococcus casseliflavus]
MLRRFWFQAQEQRSEDRTEAQCSARVEPDKPEPSPPSGPSQLGGDGGDVYSDEYPKSSSADTRIHARY